MKETGTKDKMQGHCPQCGQSLPVQSLAGLCPACLLKQGAAHETATEPMQVPFDPPPLDQVRRLFPQLEIFQLLGKGYLLSDYYKLS